jgi:hypothetical protein
MELESFLKSVQLFIYSKIFQPEGTLFCPQDPSSEPYPKPDKSSHYQIILFF